MSNQSSKIARTKAETTAKEGQAIQRKIDGTDTQQKSEKKKVAVQAAPEITP